MRTHCKSHNIFRRFGNIKFYKKPGEEHGSVKKGSIEMHENILMVNQHTKIAQAQL